MKCKDGVFPKTKNENGWKKKKKKKFGYFISKDPIFPICSFSENV